MFVCNPEHHESVFYCMRPEELVAYIERNVECGKISVIDTGKDAYMFYNKEQNGMLRQSNAGYWYFSFTDSICNYVCTFDTTFDEGKRYQSLVYRLLVAFVGA